MPARIKLRPIEPKEEEESGPIGCLVAVVAFGFVIMGIGMAILASMGYPQ